MMIYYIIFFLIFHFVVSYTLGRMDKYVSDNLIDSGSYFSNNWFYLLLTEQDYKLYYFFNIRIVYVDKIGFEISVPFLKYWKRISGIQIYWINMEYLIMRKELFFYNYKTGFTKKIIIGRKNEKEI